MKGTGKGACILPHGVLFRGNAEGVIRRQLVGSGMLKGIIGLPAILFYGTGIPACILVLDKENAAARTGVFMIDGAKGFIKDGNKNRLREQDIHRIVDAFTKQADVPRYARIVPFNEIADSKNDYNLNLPRYIDSTSPEELQDIDGHLRGGIPERDLDALGACWQVLPAVRAALFEPFDPSGGRPGYARLKPPIAEVKSVILGHAEFLAFQHEATQHFDDWRASTTKRLSAFDQNEHSKALIESIAEELLVAFKPAPLLDAYDIYQHLMDYWAETMQDVAYLIAADGWVAKPARILETDKKGKRKDKGWNCDLIPKPLIVARYFNNEQAALDATQAELETTTAAIAELEEEHSEEDAAFSGFDSISAASVKECIREMGKDLEGAVELLILTQWLHLTAASTALKKHVRYADSVLDALVLAHYPKLTEAEIKTLALDDKWMARLSSAVQGELDRVSQTLTGRIPGLAERYSTPLPKLTDEVTALTHKVEAHLAAMGAVWE